MTWFWFAAMVFFGVLEGFTVSLVSLWFAGGALAALIATLLGASGMTQWILFTLVSVALLASLRPLVKGFLQKDVTPTNTAAIIGKTVLVTERIDNIRATGTVKVNGVTWTARSLDGSVIEPETLVEVHHIEGAKVLVYPAQSAGYKTEQA